jgi:hypothetical protein
LFRPTLSSEKRPVDESIGQLADLENAARPIGHFNLAVGDEIDFKP